MVSSDYYVIDNSNMESKKIDAANNLYKMGDYSSALRLYLELLNTSLSYKLYLQIGKCYYKLNEFTTAEKYFNKSISIKPFENTSFLYLGNICYKNKNHSGAIFNWLNIFSYKPEEESVCKNIATSYFTKGMNFQSVYYYQKYLKYANINDASYTEIKDSIEKCINIGDELIYKAKQAIAKNRYNNAIEYLLAAANNIPTNFDINYMLGTVYLKKNDNMHALVYFKQAFCIDNYSIDVIQQLISVYINIGDYTAAYCMMRRLLPKVIHNQTTYLQILKSIKDLSAEFDKFSHIAHKEWGDRYYDDNNYHLALIEYENCILINDKMQNELKSRIELLKSFINPEQQIIEKAIAEGNKLYEKEMYQEANKFFTRVMGLSDNSSKEYKLAKSKLIINKNV